MGPGALLALLTYNYTHHLGPEFAILLCFIAGCMELLFGLLHLGERMREDNVKCNISYSKIFFFYILLSLWVGIMNIFVLRLVECLYEKYKRKNG
jgi:hypothetical protein